MMVPRMTSLENAPSRSEALPRPLGFIASPAAARTRHALPLGTHADLGCRGGRVVLRAPSPARRIGGVGDRAPRSAVRIVLSADGPDLSGGARRRARARPPLDRAVDPLLRAGLPVQVNGGHAASDPAAPRRVSAPASGVASVAHPGRACAPR